MLARLIYLLVIVIWATTPLAIKLGGESLAPMAALTLRISIAFLAGCSLCTIAGYTNLNIKDHWPLYLAGSISLFPNMALVYFAAKYISSGLIALMFGLSPFFTAVLARPILGKSLLNRKKGGAIMLACIGLAVIFFDSRSLSNSSYLGIGLMLISNVLFSSSALWVKKLSNTIYATPFEQTLGAMAFSLPGMYLSWWLLFGIEPLHFTAVSFGSLVYLSLFASLIGFVAYYYILNHFAVETVSLIPLITPVLAMLLGLYIADEELSTTMLIGSIMILIALGIHQNIGRSLYNLRKQGVPRILD